MPLPGKPEPGLIFDEAFVASRRNVSWNLTVWPMRVRRAPFRTVPT
jgi:hypothetical protein